MDAEKAKELFKFLFTRQVTSLYVDFIQVAEDILKEHEIMLEKLKKEIPAEYHPIIDTANYFGEERFERYRKRILDEGNKLVRESDKLVDKFDISFF
jgi:hypothetical protein